MEEIDHDLHSQEKIVPITIIAGFLGAGKTTLLNRILTEDHGLQVAVLVNDFGSVNIDADLIVGVDNNVISLTNGCVCCTINDDLVETVMKTISLPERPNYIMLEVSGVAEPYGIAATFMNPSMQMHVRLDSIICIVDASQIFDYPELMETKIRQVAFSDMVILNKTDLVNMSQINQVKDWFASRMHRFNLVETSHCDVPIDILLSVGRFDPAKMNLDEFRREHSDSCDLHQLHSQPKFSTWTYQTDKPLSLKILREIASKLPANIYRVKGVVYALEYPSRRVVLQVVGRRVDTSLEDSWGDRIPRTQIVLIGASSSIDEDLFQQKFELCLRNNLEIHDMK